jgi:hypothetical protein
MSSEGEGQVWRGECERALVQRPGTVSMLRARNSPEQPRNVATTIAIDDGPVSEWVPSSGDGLCNHKPRGAKRNRRHHHRHNVHDNGR